VTSVAFGCGYRADVGFTPSSWDSYVTPGVNAIAQSSGALQPVVAYEAEINGPAVKFTDDIQSVSPGGTYPTRKSRYLRLLVRVDDTVGNGRSLFSFGTGTAIQSGSFPGQLVLNSGFGGVNAIDVPFGTFRRLDAVISVAAADTWLRFGSIITRGGSANASVTSAGIAICGFTNNRPNITVAGAWVTQGRPTDLELANWDAADVAKYGAGVLA
jgi:hypothetical protein